MDAAEKLTQSVGSPYKNTVVPKDVQRLIGSGIIDYSGACEYYAKLADMASSRVSAFMNPYGNRRFKLDKDFSRFFRSCLKELIGQIQTVSGSPHLPADYVAHALWRASWLYKRSNNHEVDLKYLRRQQEAWPPEKPISESWQRLGDVGEGEILTEGTYEWYKSSLRLPETDFEYPRIKIVEHFNGDRAKLPRLTLEVEGEPVALVNRARYQLQDREERKQVRRAAKKIMESVFTLLMKRLQLKTADANRPRDSETGGEAARLHDLDGLPWSSVAKQLCKIDHGHTANCAMRVRQAAARWYKESSPHRIPIVNN
jgi:hypothetical protein